MTLPTISAKNALCCAALGLLTACNIQEIGMRSAVGSLYPYLVSPETEGPVLVKLTDHVYTYRWQYYRTIAIVTSEGLVLTDPLNAQAAEILKAEMAKVAPGAKVHTIIYTHYHLDHVSGGAVLVPGAIVAHQKCPEYWKDLDAKDVMAPTSLIDGDQTMTIGGIEIRLLYLGNSHSDTLYAIHLPGERLLFTADLGLVRVFTPTGGPQYYFPGVQRALDRLVALDFDTFVPSHWGYGKKADLVEFNEFNKFAVAKGHEAIQKFGLIPASEDATVEMWNFWYEAMKERYSTWHGFNQMILFLYTRVVVGEQLGY